MLKPQTALKSFSVKFPDILNIIYLFGPKITLDEKVLKRVKTQHSAEGVAKLIASSTSG